MTRSDGTILRAVDVTKSFRRGRDQITVLEHLDLEVRAGELLILMGPSGSGKTTLLNLLSGLDRPDSGYVEVEGRRLDQMSNRQLARWRSRHVGLVFQSYNLMPAMTAARNVELPLLLTPLSARRRREHVANALALVGLSDRAKHRPRELSGGQEQRVAIARAIVSDPTFLLCDEPTGDLDRKTGAEILQLLQTLNREQGKTIILVTHDPAAIAFGSRVLALRGGVLEPEAA